MIAIIAGLLIAAGGGVLSGWIARSVVAAWEEGR